MDPDRNKRLAEVTAIAVRLEAETGVPAQCIVAQWAVESRWGAKPVGHANYFGIKRAVRHQKHADHATHEVIGGREQLMTCEFADYDSLEESCADYAWLISHGKPYANAWAAYQRERSVPNLIDRVARVYATAPSYAEMVRQIAYQGNVTAAIAAARKVAA